MAVLKQAGEGAVRSLLALAVPTTPVEDEASRLRAELAEARATIDAARRDIATARQEGMAEGRKAGIASVERSERDRIASLDKAIGEERERLAERLSALDALAAALARACLDRVFARPDAMAAMVVDALEHRLMALRDRTGLHVRVSGKDFGDPAAITAIDADVTIDPDLPSGACRLSVRLGQIDLDLPGQWATIAQALDEMAAA